MKNSLPILILTLALTSNSQAGSLEPLKQAFEKRIKLRSTSVLKNEVLLKNNLDSLRDKEELLGERALGYANAPVDSKSPKAFSTEFLLNSKFQKLTFKSGDVIVLRGSSALSALVSNITDTPSSYSHAVIVYIDGNNRRWGIEALVDKGVVLQKLDDILSEGVPRMMVYRHRDAKLANLAGKAAYEMSQLTADGKVISYDTKLDLMDDSAVYCSELIRVAYAIASKNQILLPTFPSTIGGKFPGLRHALELQISKFVVYSPLDLDLDAQFDLLAEWRDFKNTVNFRIKDQIIKTVLNWLESQKDNIRTLKKAGEGQQENSSSSGEDNTGKILDGLNKILSTETLVFAQANKTFLETQKRNMNTEELQSAIDNSQLLDHVKIIFIQNEFLKY